MHQCPLDETISERERFILSKSETFSPLEIVALLERENFMPLTHGRIYQILKEHGIKPFSNRPWSFKQGSRKKDNAADTQEPQSE